MRFINSPVNPLLEILVLRGRQLRASALHNNFPGLYLIEYWYVAKLVPTAEYKLMPSAGSAYHIYTYETFWYQR